MSWSYAAYHTISFSILLGIWKALRCGVSCVLLNWILLSKTIDCFSFGWWTPELTWLLRPLSPSYYLLNFGVALVIELYSFIDRLAVFADFIEISSVGISICSIVQLVGFGSNIEISFLRSNLLMTGL